VLYHVFKLLAWRQAKGILLHRQEQCQRLQRCRAYPKRRPARIAQRSAGSV